MIEEKFEAANSLECQNLGLTDPFHLKEDSDYWDSNFDEACQSTDSEDSDPDESHDNRNTHKLLYPGASITVEESILSVMKYALRHKTSYSALSDLLHLITLHLPTESYDEHFQSLYFLKKAFTSQSKLNGHGNTDIVKVHEYCPTCIALWKDDNERTCRFCGEQRKRKTNNYFLALDIGAQLKSMFEGTAQYLLLSTGCTG